MEEDRVLSTGGPSAPIRILFALPGFHRVERGAEVALEAVASELSRMSEWAVTVIGTGADRPERGYQYLRVGCVRRERFMRWPKCPTLRDHYSYEEFTFLPGLFRRFRPSAFDVTISCGFPWLNWGLRVGRRRCHPAHIFVTQNGDWPVRAGNREYRWFGCDGLVCTNPEYFERHQHKWPSALIPNGVSPDQFSPGSGDRSEFGIPDDVPLVLMVSALIPSKRVVEGIIAVAALRSAHMLVLGDGEEAAEADAMGRKLLGDRYRRTTIARDRMPGAYRCSDVLLHMSKDEPFGNVYVEALATGLPVVTHDRDMTRWLLEDTSILVDTDDQDQVRRGLSRALESNADSQVSARRELVQRRFTWSAVAERYSTFIRGTVLTRCKGRGL